jgi:hypothetical protein
MERSVLFVDRNKIKNWSSTVIREFIDLSFKALLFRMVLFRIFIPIEGRHHDAGMLMESNVLAQMANHMTSPNGHIFSVYGDPAYPLGDGYIIPWWCNFKKS